MNVSQPLVSIITVVFNGDKTLEQTILSVINQSYINIQYIIIDGGSTDNTINIIKRYDHKIDYWESVKDKGIYDAMNKGLQKAKGAIIGMINADDWYELDAIENIVYAYVHNPDCDVYHGLLRFFSPEGNPDSVAGHYGSFLRTGMIEHPTCFLKKAIYDQHGAFDLRYKSAADFDFMNRIKGKDARFFFVNKIIANFRRGGVSSLVTSLLEELEIKRKYKYIPYKKYIIWICIIKLSHLLKHLRIL